ncbi:hypothetical protein [Actinokineospora pegani]|uniref:hypothetical protein n=1 Tax=Actinokineospora pegani TaxID=2654637 RepID=UPI0012EAC4F9|nr:hypothetical protein [Actinokineospora pegani]
MTCEEVPLAHTGSPLALLLAIAALAVVAGVLLVRSARGRAAFALLPLLLLGALATAERPASADTVCLLRIEQTSVNENLRPGAAPQLISGRVTNDAPESTRVAAITVGIAGVTKARGAVAGECDASDYRLTETRMPVARLLGPGESAVFSGARISFVNKDQLQDACQGAEVLLRYRSS